MLPWLVTCAILLAVYFAIDSFMFSRDVKGWLQGAPEEKQAIGVDGGINILFLAAIVGTVLMSGFWRSGVDFTFLGVHFSLEGRAPRRALHRDLRRFPAAYHEGHPRSQPLQLGSDP